MSRKKRVCLASRMFSFAWTGPGKCCRATLLAGVSVLALGVAGGSQEVRSQGIPGLGTALPAIGIPTPGRQLGGVPIVGVPLVAPMVLDGLNSGGFNVMGGAPQVVSDAVLMYFRAVGGNGSGGGLGAGGAFFIGAGSSLLVNNATFVNNWAVGGNGGAPSVLTGGALNGGGLIPGTWDALLLTGQAAGLPLSGLSWAPAAGSNTNRATQSTQGLPLLAARIQPFFAKPANPLVHTQAQARPV